MLLSTRLPRTLIAALPLSLLAACVGLPGISSTPGLLHYQPEAFEGRAYARHFAVRPERACEAARRALLSQGYIVKGDAIQVSGRKYFQPSAERHVQLEFRVVCTVNGRDAETSMAFASGLNEQYTVRKVRESASLGVGGIGSLSLPVEGSMDSMVKIASETVTDSELYERFFDLVVAYLDDAVAPDDPGKAGQAES